MSEQTDHPTRAIDEVRRRLVDEHGIPYVEENGERIALVTQTAYSCLHATRSHSDAALRAAGYTKRRFVGFLDVGSVCDGCKARRAAKRASVTK